MHQCRQKHTHNSMYSDAGREQPQDVDVCVSTSCVQESKFCFSQACPKRKYDELRSRIRDVTRLWLARYDSGNRGWSYDIDDCYVFVACCFARSFGGGLPPVLASLVFLLCFWTTTATRRIISATTTTPPLYYCDCN